MDIYSCINRTAYRDFFPTSFLCSVTSCLICFISYHCLCSVNMCQRFRLMRNTATFIFCTLIHQCQTLSLPSCLIFKRIRTFVDSTVIANGAETITFGCLLCLCFKLSLVHCMCVVCVCVFQKRSASMIGLEGKYRHLKAKSGRGGEGDIKGVC